MPRRLTQEEFEEKVKQVHNGNIIVLSKYINSKSKVHFKDIRCGHNWWSAAGVCYQRGDGCPICGAKQGAQLKSTSQVKKELDACTNEEYTLLSSYTGIHKDIMLLHNKCGYHWKTSLNAVISGGQRCPKCFGNLKHTQEEAQQIITKKLGPEFKLVSNYKNVEEKITIEHVSMKHTFTTRLNTIIAGQIFCPICNESHMESLTRQYLIEHNITFESQKRFPDCRYQHELPFDFYVPEDNTLIELDGRQHFKEIPYFDQREGLAIRTRRDTIKDQYCTDKGINLLRIGYSELDNLTNDLDKYLSNFQGITRVGKEYQK